jgi:hypothetical protein
MIIIAKMQAKRAKGETEVRRENRRPLMKVQKRKVEAQTMVKVIFFM